MELPDSRASDLDSDYSPGDFTPSGAPSEDFLSEPGIRVDAIAGH
jgi:hypothetical protein